MIWLADSIRSRIKMANSLNDVIKRLEQQRTGIDRALAALRQIEGPGLELAEAAPAAAPGGRRKAKRKGGMTPEGRRRLSEALKARWAAKKSGSAAPAAPAKAKRKGGMTPEGRKRLSEALRKRWAAKRAAGAVPAKTGRAQVTAAPGHYLRPGCGAPSKTLLCYRGNFGRCEIDEARLDCSFISSGGDSLSRRPRILSPQ